MILYYHKNIANALIELFPNIGFDKLSLQNWQCNFIILYYFASNFFTYKIYSFIAHTGNLKNQKIFFEKFARERGFDPLIADNWYSQKRREIINQKV